MYGLTAMRRWNRRGARGRGLAAVALAALLLLSALHAPALSQTVGRPKYEDFKTTVGMAAGQTVRILIVADDDSTASHNTTGGGLVSARVKVFDGRTGSLLQSHEIRRVPNVYQYVDVMHSALPPVGELGTERIQLGLEVRLIFAAAEEGAEETAAVVVPPVFELMDAARGTTTVHGKLDLVGKGTVEFTGLD